MKKKPADSTSAPVAAHPETEKNGHGQHSPPHHQIAEVAFTLYDSRGYQDGFHVEDWLRAEKQLVEHPR